MKLRTTHNSIRLRIRKSELAKLAATQMIEESVKFPGGNLFTYKLCLDEEIDKLSADWEGASLSISLPQTQSNTWIQTNQVGIEAYLDLPDKEKLHILIEKDFPCLDRVDEDKSDTFEELVPEKPESC